MIFHSRGWDVGFIGGRKSRPPSESKRQPSGLRLDVKFGKGTRTRYAFKAETKDGRSLTAFVKKADWDAFKK